MHQVRLRADERRWAIAASGASDGALPAATADEALPPASADADAGKWVVLVQGGRALGASVLLFARSAESASVAAPCTQGADPSAERSCAAAESPELQALPAQPQLVAAAEHSATAQVPRAEPLAPWSLP